MWLLEEKLGMVSCDLKGSNIQCQYSVILVLLCVFKDPRGLWNAALKIQSL